MRLRILPIFICFTAFALMAGGTKEPVEKPVEKIEPAKEVTTVDTVQINTKEIPSRNVDLPGMAALGFEFPEQAFPAQDVPLTPLDGSEQIMLSDFRGKVVLLNFWATWCPPCQKEMPSMERLNDFLDGKDFVMLGVDVDEETGKVQKFIKDKGYTFPIFLDQNNEVYPYYGTGSIPTSYIIDKQGHVAARIIGSIEWDQELIQKDMLTLISE